MEFAQQKIVKKKICKKKKLKKEFWTSEGEWSTGTWKRRGGGHDWEATENEIIGKSAKKKVKWDFLSSNLVETNGCSGCEVLFSEYWESSK